MTRVILFLTLGLALAAADARAGAPQLDADGSRDAELERLLDDGLARSWEPDRRTPLLAPATGGLLGWFMPQLYFWYPTIDGRMGETNQDSFDFQDDLGLDDRELGIVPGIQVSLGAVGIRFSAFFLDFSGSGQINRDVTFGGVTFPISEEVDSDLSIDNYRLTSMLPIVKTGVFVLALQGGISWYHLEGTVTGRTTGTATESGDAPIPVAGVLLQARLGRFVLEADVMGLSLDLGDVSVDLLELQVSVGITLFKVVSVRGGYRLIEFDGEVNDFFVDATIDGFFVGATLNF